MSCETFCLDDDEAFIEATNTLQSESLTHQSVRFVDSNKDDTASALSKCHNKKVRTVNSFLAKNKISEIHHI